MAIELIPGFGSFTPAGGGGGGLDGSESDGTNVLTGGVGMTSGWIANNATLTTSVTTAPDGTNTSALLTENTSNTRHIVYQQAFVTGQWTFSVYAKANGRRYLQLLVGDGNTAKSIAYYDLQTGTVTDTEALGAASVSSTNIEVGANGFYKVTLVGQVAAGTVNCFFQYNLSDVSTYGAPLVSDSPSYTGDGASGIYLWRPKAVD